MLDRIRGVFRARAGDVVAVTEGPYAGRTGTLLDDAAADGRFTVFIDECCQPRLATTAFRRIRRGSRVADAARKAKQADLDSEIVRHAMDQRDLGNGF